MPSWPVHIALASKLKRKYNFTDDFILGSIMPDATNGFIIKDISNVISHAVTHFNYQGPNRPPKNDVEKFLEVYKDKLDNSIILGSLIHIITDNYFNEYTCKNHIKNIDGKRVAILKDGSINDVVTPWKLKQEDFGVFGNYLISNNELGNEISKTGETSSLILCLSYSITDSDINMIIDKINSFITRTPSSSYNYKMFTEDELINLFEDCYKHLNEIIKKILVKRKDD